MEIIKVWRAMAGVKGRKPHRPAPVPLYEYEKGCTEAAKADKLKAAAAVATAPAPA